MISRTTRGAVTFAALTAAAAVLVLAQPVPHQTLPAGPAVVVVRSP